MDPEQTKELSILMVSLIDDFITQSPKNILKKIR